MLGYLANVSLPFVVQLHELALVEKLGTVNTVFCSRAIREGDKKKKKGKVAPVNQFGVADDPSAPGKLEDAWVLKLKVLPRGCDLYLVMPFKVRTFSLVGLVTFDQHYLMIGNH